MGTPKIVGEAKIVGAPKIVGQSKLSPLPFQRVEIMSG